MNWEAKFRSLVLLLTNETGGDIYPMGHLSSEQRQKLRDTDGYRLGWDDAQIECSERVGDAVQRAEAILSDDLTMLLASGFCFMDEKGTLSLNMNDTWGWALSWCPEVPTEAIKEVARLYRSYGLGGLMYWHSCQEKDMRSEFADNNRAIDFVRREELVRTEVPDSNKRAYHKTSYMIGGESDATQ